MAAQQADRHELGRLGEAIVASKLGGETTRHTAPFDVVDFGAGVAYEVKTMSGMSADLKIHISDSSMARKRKFRREYKLKAVLIAVVVYSETDIRVYRSALKQSIRINQMREVK